MAVYVDGIRYCPCEDHGGGGYQSPGFTSFYADGRSASLEVGDTFAANPTFIWATSYSANVAADSISILDVTGGTTLVTGLANTGSYAATHATITETTNTSWEFRILGQDSISATFARNYVLAWKWMVYSGESASAGPLNQAAIKALRVSGLASAYAGDYLMLAGNYKYICYPAVYGTATNFTDRSTGFPVAMDDPYTVSVTNGFSQTTNYRVHRSYYALGGALTITVS